MIIRRVLVISVVVLLTGCGSFSPPTPTPEPVTLNFAFQRNVADFKPLADEFHKQYPNVTVELIPITDAGNLARQTTRPVDVLRWDGSYLTPERLSSLRSLDVEVRSGQSFPLDDLYPGALDVFRLEGKVWAVPAGLDLLVSFYDAKVFKAAQVTAPSANWTLDDWVATGLALKRAAAPPKYVVCSTPNSLDPVIVAYLFGGGLFDRMPNPTRPLLDQPANAKAVQWYADLYRQQGLLPDPAEIERSFSRNGINEPIVRGQCGVWLGLYSSQGGKLWGFQWMGEGVLRPLPRGSAAFNVMTVDGYYVLSQTKYAQEAWQWITFLLDRQQASGLQVPPRKSHIASEAFANRVGPDAAYAVRNLPANAVVLGSEASFGPAVEIVGQLYLEVVNKAMRGDLRSIAEIESALKDAQARALARFRTQ